MKIKLLIFTLAAIFMFTGGAAKGFGQEVPMTGAYSEADAKNPEIVKAAEFAVRTQGEKQKSAIRLVSVDAAKTQVVAGMNYQICMKVSVKKKSAKSAADQFVTAVVYRNLQNKYSLTSWTTVAKGSTCESN